jgi:hypothetical protein
MGFQSQRLLLTEGVPAELVELTIGWSIDQVRRRNAHVLSRRPFERQIPPVAHHTKTCDEPLAWCGTRILARTPILTWRINGTILGWNTTVAGRVRIRLTGGGPAVVVRGTG